MPQEPLYRTLAQLIDARDRCAGDPGKAGWENRHQERIESLVRERMPHGSGFDSGTMLDDNSTPEKLVFYTSFHHMNDAGMYSGWTEHKVTVKPSLRWGFVLTVSGRDRNEIKGYIEEEFNEALGQDCGR